jgi:amino-acid N-acetyltransferase
VGSSIDIRPVESGDLERCIRLLGDAGLPVADLSLERLALVAVDPGTGSVVGAIGLEQLGELGLLRSLVVDREGRRTGLGGMLVVQLEALARLRGIRELWLLTIDADAYFTRHGYIARDRADAPEAIRKTEEFSSLCPGDAVLMQKPLV